MATATPAKKAAAKKAPAKKAAAKTPVKKDYDSLKKGVETLLDKYGTAWCQDGKNAVAKVLKPLGVESDALESKWFINVTFATRLEEKNVSSTRSYGSSFRQPSAAWKAKVEKAIEAIEIDGIKLRDVNVQRTTEV